LGFSYDGSETSTVRDYVPTARPGARLPHAWIEQNGARASLLDLIRYDRFTLIAGRDGEAWLRAAEACPAANVTALLAGRDFTDPDGRWAAVCEIEPSGALLVRPDQHVAWRAVAMVDDPKSALASAFRIS